MANIPTPRSYVQTLSDILDGIRSRLGIPRIKTGSPTLAIAESAAQSDFRVSQDIFNMMSSQDLDKAEGLALDRHGLDEDAPRFTESLASGLVTIGDSSFDKISTKVFAGRPAPIIGTTTLSISDGSEFESGGEIYIGRDTTNYEGPIAYTGLPVQDGAHWNLTLATPTARFHNTGESLPS